MNLSILFILTICCVFGHEIYTTGQLRGMYKHTMNKLLYEEVQHIVERVIRVASFENKTSYTESYLCCNKKEFNILTKFTDDIISNRLKNVLIDSNITISEPKCCNPNYCLEDYQGKVQVQMCKFIVINW
jgi:hypothetical protein